MKNQKKVFLFVAGFMLTGSLTYSAITQKSQPVVPGSRITSNAMNNLVQDIAALNLAIDGVSGGTGKFVNGTTVTDAVFTAGNVGIGTTTPVTKLQIDTGNISLTDENGLGWGASAGVAPTNGIKGNGTTNYVALKTNGSEKIRIDASGNMGIGTDAPTDKLDIVADNIRIRTAKTPANATEACDQGEISWDTGYVYICTATNTWKRSALATW